MRKIFLPELIRINIRNFTLYPNGLDYSYDFVKGVNLILGGNGMGKTTFVNIIKYAIIGHYKKHYDHTRTYKDRNIEKRLLYPKDYFKNRMDNQILNSEDATVTIEFRCQGKTFEVERNLETITLSSLKIENKQIQGDIISQLKYENLKPEEKESYLPYKYEQLIKKHSNLSFDDLIFFVNQILFFGEDHKTILWNDGQSGDDVQNELFNKYFNSPELDERRKEAERKAKYYDSLSRHRSEDIRAIKKVLDKINENKNNKGTNSLDEILKIKKQIEDVTDKIDRTQKARVDNDIKSSFLQDQINKLALQVGELEDEKNKSEKELKSKIWEKVHPQYDSFIRNIKNNHICPICNRLNEEKLKYTLEHPENCFACGQELEPQNDNILSKIHKDISEKYKKLHEEIKNKQQEIKKIEEENQEYDKEFRLLESNRRELQANLRNYEFINSKSNEHNDLQAFLDEISRLEEEKQDLQEKSKKETEKAKKISKEIEQHIADNTYKFSSLFSGFAENFLGVKCSLTFDDLGNGVRFYPVIDEKIRTHEEELSESQRFFIDHSFRMSILSFFYTTPTFYIVETPDSSLDISYEKNAANVFLKFLQQPNIIIITSNLNNSTFINYIVDNKSDINVSMIGLLDIAKKSTIQNTNTTLIELYSKIKDKIKTK